MIDRALVSSIDSRTFSSALGVFTVYPYGWYGLYVYMYKYVYILYKYILYIYQSQPCLSISCLVVNLELNGLDIPFQCSTSQVTVAFSAKNLQVPTPTGEGGASKGIRSIQQMLDSQPQIQTTNSKLYVKNAMIYDLLYIYTFFLSDVESAPSKK